MICEITTHYPNVYIPILYIYIFDEVWQQGLKYKILHLGLNIDYEKILSNFITDRQAYIHRGNYTALIGQAQTNHKTGLLAPPS